MEYLGRGREGERERERERKREKEREREREEREERERERKRITAPACNNISVQHIVTIQCLINSMCNSTAILITYLGMV